MRMIGTRAGVVGSEMPSWDRCPHGSSISPQSCGSAFGPNILYHLGDDYHPPSNLDGGENLLKGVYESLTANAEAWNKTLLVVTFDEPVGSFDHVPPPAAFPPWEKGQAPARLEKGFAFDRLGGRVPTLLVSPLIDKGTVFRSETGIPYDHTSLIATLLKWRGQKQKLANFGKRAQNAPTFENVITRREPRTDALDVPFLKGRKIGDTVRYLDRFRLCNEHGTYVSTFSEEFAEWALFSAPFAQDSAIKEYFPTVGAESKKASLLYFVNPDHRADDGEIVRHVGREDSRNPSSRVKLIGQDKGLGSYNVLGVWKDSRSCYYSHDYTEGDNDQKERWLISQAVRDHEFREDRRLRYGQRVTIQSQLYPEWFLAPDGRFLKTTREDLTWTLLPANLRWSASATNDQRGEWQAPVFSPDGEPLLGLAALKDDGYGIVNLRGIAGDYGIHGTPWTSDDCPSVPLLSKHSPNVRDQIAAVHLRTQGDYGIVDLSFETKKGFHSDWFTKNRDFTKLVSIRVPSDAVLVGLIGRKWAKHGLMDVQLAYQ